MLLPIPPSHRAAAPLSYRHNIAHNDGMSATSDLRIGAGVIRGEPVRFTCDGAEINAFEGETVAAALWAAGVRRASADVASAHGPPWRTMFCLMGVCQQCVVWVDGRRVESCRVAVARDLVVRTSR